MDDALHDTQLTLTGLPPHDRLSLGFLLAVIDSWDGVELLEVTVDGALLFSNSFQLATGDSSSYTPPPGGLLSSGTDLGFSAGGYYDHDRAYDMALEPAFIDIPHTTATVTIVWRLLATPGGGANVWQGGTDESWAIDNITVDVGSGAVTTTTTVTSTSTTTTSVTAATTTTSSSTLAVSTSSAPVTTLPPTTTTTTLAGGCATIPDGPTFASIRCRLEALRAATAATTVLGSLVPKLDQPLGKGLDRVGEAQTQCASGDAKHPKARLKQVIRQLLQYSHRLRGLKARKTAPTNVREPLAGVADGIGRDATMLRRTLRCPADAT